MSNPAVHTERSVKKWGGVADDYMQIHQWFDATKAHVPDNRHRIVLHNGFGIALAEQVFGAEFVNSVQKRVFIRDIGAQHVLEDLGFIPSLAECLTELPLRPWMAGARKVLPVAQRPRLAECDNLCHDTLLNVAKTLLEICRWKCSPQDEVVLADGRTNHQALVEANEVIIHAEANLDGQRAQDTSAS